ncbi:uncharacterized protein RCC_04861 [Ramularia collo-cygni]|uniref:Uncharacterized protein n=1 Tax=Ramularia collo-cygni TaxID=112498 RepID=A0A2D3V653_9PEZI|nr:uncharacterized protein RCC_04861 [Ramularia collo-cygni]CZT19016.1 uncharacterized protein RCC_04861 [Ramularia collo-cygni]
MYSPRPREHDAYTRDDNPLMGSGYYDDYEALTEYACGNRASSRHDTGPVDRPRETDLYFDRRYRERGIQRRDSPEFEAASTYHERDGYQERDGHRMNTPPHEVRRGRDEFGRDLRVNRSPRRDRSMSPDWRDRHLSSTYFPPRPIRPPREKRQPRQSHGADYLAQPNNPNAMPIGKRGAAERSPLPMSSEVNVPPPRFADARHACPPRRPARVICSIGLNTFNAASSRQQANVSATTKPLPLPELPLNIHPSRRAAMSQNSSEGGGSREAANMITPRNHLETIAQSIEPSDKDGPALMSKGSNANAVPLGSGKRTRF